jgi:TonB family protein
MLVEVHLTTDSIPNSTRLLQATFPRMPIRDAVPSRDNPTAAFPPEERGDSTRRGEVVFRFVVDRDGKPEMETLEILRAGSLAFVRAALAVMPQQRFMPASIKGCAVAQLVSYPFAFVLPDTVKVPRHH